MEKSFYFHEWKNVFFFKLIFFFVAAFKVLCNELLYPFLTNFITILCNISNLYVRNLIPEQKQILRLMFGTNRRGL